MPNITVYLPDDVARDARRIARKENLPFSRWVAALIARHMRSGTAPGVLSAAGAIPDFPSVDELRSGYGSDAEREGLE
jgi:hypothetical protein